MADNLDITAGTGTTIKTDDVGGVHYQQVKLVDGTLEATAVIAADIGVKANALRVVPANNITDGTYIGDIKFGEALPIGSNAIGKLAANSGVDIGDVDVTSCADTSGDIAHDSPDSGKPIKIGGKAHPHDGTVPGTAVAENDRAHFISDQYGRQFVETMHPNSWDTSDNQSTAQTNNELKATPGAGLSLYITDIIISNGATAGNIKFVEDTGGSPVDKVEVMYFAINGGAAIHLTTPIRITANKNFGYTSVTVTTHSITICGFIAP